MVGETTSLPKGTGARILPGGVVMGWKKAKPGNLKSDLPGRRTEADGGHPLLADAVMHRHSEVYIPHGWLVEE